MRRCQVCSRHSSAPAPPELNLSQTGHQTGRIQRLEPVTNYLVTHSEMHLARSVHSARKLNGVPQPLPETIRLEFSAFGQDHSYEASSRVVSAADVSR